MKPTVYFLGLTLAIVPMVAFAEETPAPAEEAAAPVAPTTTAEKPNTSLIPGLPKYSPPPPETKSIDKPTDPDVMELPKMTIKQKPRPRLTPEIMVTRKAFGEDLAKQKYSSLDQALNKFTLPLFGTSLAERALEDHAREKNEQMVSEVATMSKALEQSDPAEAKALREAAAKR